MDLSKILRVLTVAIVMSVVSACSVQYKFNAASINYDEIKTIQIADFPLRTALVWAPMRAMFNNQLQDTYANQTRLQLVKRRMTVNVRFVNMKNHTQDFERRFTATSEYDSSQSLNSVQEELVTEMIQNITDQIFNATVANW